MEKQPDILLIVPPNDEEAYLIAELGERKGYRIHRSTQPHGARLDKEPRVLEIVKESGARTVIIVEMPGLAAEEKIRALGVHLILIDHHNYTDLDRAHAPDGSPLPSSLEQFLRVADIEDVHLRRWGYDPLVVRGIGLWDAGYLWALMDAGYSKEDIERTVAFKDAIAKKVGSPEMDATSQKEARRAFDEREPFQTHDGLAFVVVSLHPTAHIRSAISRLFAMTFWKPTTVLISERGGKRLYVQETNRALDLFHHFGGFTFGTDRNWGYDNDTEEERVMLGQVKEFLLENVK